MVNGSNDIVVPTVNSYALQQNLPNADHRRYAPAMPEFSFPAQSAKELLHAYLEPYQSYHA